MDSHLINRTVLALASEISDHPLKGVVVGVTENSLAVRLDETVHLPNAENARYLVASIRHEYKTLADIAEGRQVLCGLILVPALKFKPNEPCDVSWWRGGAAAVGDVVLVKNEVAPMPPP